MAYSEDVILEGYTTLMSDINELYEMIGNTKKEVEYHGKEKSRQSRGNCR